MTREPIWFDSEVCCEISVFAGLPDSRLDPEWAVDQRIRQQRVDDELALLRRIATSQRPVLLSPFWLPECSG